MDRAQWDHKPPVLNPFNRSAHQSTSMCQCHNQNPYSISLLLHWDLATLALLKPCSSINVTVGPWSWCFVFSLLCHGLLANSFLCPFFIVYGQMSGFHHRLPFLQCPMLWRLIGFPKQVLSTPDFPLSSAHCSLSRCLITSICKQYTFNQGLHICHTHSLSQMCSLPLGIKIIFFYIMLTYLCRPLSSCLCLETLYSSFHLHVYNEFPLLGSSSFCMCQLLTVFSMKKTMHSDSKESTWAAAVRWILKWNVNHTWSNIYIRPN